MLMSYKRGQGSIVLRVKILDSTASTGAGKTGLTSASSSLIISTIADNEATATAYTVAASNVETITTLGTFSAPTSGKCRFKEVDSTNHKGVYEIQIADARFAVSSAKSLLVSIVGATGAAETDAVIPLMDIDPYDSVRAGLTSLPNAAANTNGGLPVLSSSGTTLAYTISTLTTYTGNTPQTGDSYARIGATGSGLTSLAPSSTALSTATWTTTRAGYIDNLSAGAVALNSGVYLANGTHGGANATVTLKSINVSNSTGDAVTISSTGSDGHAIYASGNGGGDGMYIVGGSTGHGLHLQGGSTSGDGLHTVAQTSGDGIQTTGAGGGLDINGILSSVTLVNGLAAGVITSTSIAADAMTASKFASDVTTELQAGLATSTALAAAQSDLDDIQTRLPSALTADGNIKADTLRVGGTLQTARDIGASVLLSSGTGTGQISLTSGTVVVGTNNDKAGYSLTQTFPSNFSSLSISAAGLVDVTQAAADRVWGTSSRILTAGTNIVLAKGTGLTGLNDIAATDIVSAGAITTSSGSVSSVTNVDEIGGEVIVQTSGKLWVLNESGNPISTGLSTFDSTTDTVLANVKQIDDSALSASIMRTIYEAFENGTAQSGGASSITLRAGASSVNDYFKNQAVFIIEGAGIGQTARITAYDGSTKQATISFPWATQPDNTSVYLVLGRIG